MVRFDRDQYVILLVMVQLLTLNVVMPMVVEKPGTSLRNRDSRPSSPRPASKKPISKNKNWYHKRRDQGIKVARRGKKPPQWEKEGDALYQEIVHDNPYRQANEKMTHAKAQQLLQKIEMIGSKAETDTSNSAPPTPPTEPIKPEPPFIWGGLPVGPVWKQRLLQAGFDQPTPIQKEAFVPITKRNENIILASTTGSGKSLAYLLPLLTTTPKGQGGTLGRIWIVTPTTELALQLQRMVSTLLGGKEEVDDQMLHVLTIPDQDETVYSPIISSLSDCTSPMLAGTARTFQELFRELDDRPKHIYDRSGADSTRRIKTAELSQNLQTIVLDEADRLLQTEAVAREYQNRKTRTANLSTDKRQKRRSGPSSRRSPPPVTLSLLKALVAKRSLRDDYRTNQLQQLQIICASATVGRTLRRQLMEALGTTSMDKAATLIAADVRTKKDADARKTSLLPATLQHCYHLLPDSIGTGDTEEAQEIVSSLVAIMEDQYAKHPAPMLVFPGRTGVESIQSELRGQGFENVGGLDDIANTGYNPEDTHITRTWKTTPIFVVSEKLGRGLDIPHLDYVVLLQVPSSAAGYTHLAGRTGRNGRPGSAISLCRPREAPKLLMIAETLGLPFLDVQSLSAQE